MRCISLKSKVLFFEILNKSERKSYNWGKYEFVSKTLRKPHLKLDTIADRHFKKKYEWPKSTQKDDHH